MKKQTVVLIIKMFFVIRNSNVRKIVISFEITDTYMVNGMGPYGGRLAILTYQGQIVENFLRP